ATLPPPRPPLTPPFGVFRNEKPAADEPGSHRPSAVDEKQRDGNRGRQRETSSSENRAYRRRPAPPQHHLRKSDDGHRHGPRLVSRQTRRSQRECRRRRR